MVMGHNVENAKFILTGNSIADLEKGLAEMKRQIANGITFSVCCGGDTVNESDFEKEYDNTYSEEDDCDCDCDIYCCCDDCDECDCEDEDEWAIDYEDEEREKEVEPSAEDTAVDEAVNEFIKIIKDILGM